MKTKGSKRETSKRITLSALLEVNPDLIIRLNEAGEHLEVIAPKGWHSFDIEQTRRNQSVHEELPSNLAEVFMMNIQKTLAEGSLQSFKYEISSGDALRYRECRMVPFYDSQVVAIIRDNTDSRQTENLLQRIADEVTRAAGIDYLRSLAQSIVEILDCSAVFVGKIDHDEEVVNVITGVRDGEGVQPFRYNLNGTPCQGAAQGRLCLYPDRVWERFPHDKALRDANLESYVGIPLTSADGKVIGLIAVLDRKPIRKPDVFAAMFKIFAARAAAEMERLENEKRIQEMAYGDRVTGLPNRWSLTDYIENVLRSPAGRVAVLFLGINGLRQVSSRFGFMIRDELLQVIAQRLARVAEENKLFVARFGTEEFVFVCEDPPDDAYLLSIANRIIALFDYVWGPVSGEYRLQARVGVALCPEHGRSAEDLLKKAEIAMFKSLTHQMTNVNFYTGEFAAEMQHKWELETELRDAIKGEQFVLRYQPQVDIISGRIVGVEALVRWARPQKGLVPPLSFMPALEETGLILPLGEWILQEACRQASQWANDGTPVKVAVNISARQFLEANFVSQVETALDRHQLEPKLLQLEITESAAIDVDIVLPKLERLRMVGVGISLDDFGTGYSSLAYLRNFPIQVLKIDKGFVREMVEAEGKGSIVDAIISLGRSLGIEVIAEGVETVQQVNMLLDKGCHLMQGYLFAKPLPSEEIEKFQGKIQLEDRDAQG